MLKLVRRVLGGDLPARARRVEQLIARGGLRRLTCSFGLARAGIRRSDEVGILTTNTHEENNGGKTTHTCDINKGHVNTLNADRKNKSADNWRTKHETANAVAATI